MNENETTNEKQSRKYQKPSKNMFIIMGHNGASLVEPVLSDLGWTKISDKSSDDFKLKWTELVSHINYSRFKEGEQLVNHIPNGGLITNKLGLLTSLRSYDKLTKEANKNRTFEMNMFVPETYIIDDYKEREQFFEAYKEGDIWINKPTGLNQGKGITLIRDIDEFRKELDERDSISRSTMTGVKARIVQRYLSNPLLLHGRKFDIRSYMYIASTSPYLVLYCPGYIRLSMNPYSNEDTDLITHLTNQYIQKKSPNYGDVKEDTIWSMDKFNEYLNDQYANSPGYKQDWTKNTLEKQMQQIMLHIFNSVKNKMATRVGFFELYGLDFMVDSNFKIWLIEVNVNPALHVNCTLLKDILPPMIEEVIVLALECFEKCVKSKKSLIPLDNAKIFSVIHSESMAVCKSRITAYSSLKSWIPPRYRSHSLSPNRSKSDEKAPIETPQPTRPAAPRATQLPNTITLSKEIKFESSLCNNQKVNDQVASKEVESGTKSERIQPSSFVTPTHVRSKSYNPISSERRDSRMNSNFDNTIARKVIAENSLLRKDKDSMTTKPRVSTSVTFESLTLDPTRQKTELFRLNRNYNPVRKTQSVRVREPAPISLVQVVTGKKSTDTVDTRMNKMKLSQAATKKRTKVYDRSS